MQRSAHAGISGYDQHETNLELAPLSILPDELCLKERLVLVRENTGSLLQDFT